MQNNLLNIMNLVKMISILTEIAYHLKNKKKFNELVEEMSPKFKILDKMINPDNLIYMY